MYGLNNNSKSVFAKDISGGGTGAGAPLYLICIVAMFAHIKRRGVCGPAHESATQSRPCGTYSAWGAASQSARLLVTFGHKSDMRSIIMLVKAKWRFLLFHKIRNCKKCRKLHKAHYKKYQLKAELFVLVAELIHTHISAKGAKYAPVKQSAFGYAHLAFFSFVFVHTKQNKCNDVYNYKTP